MVTEYLLKKKEELIERQTQLESLLNALNSTIKEDYKMIELLGQKNRPVFSDFSPRSNKNDTKVNELRNQIEENLEKASKLKIKMQYVTDQLEELETVIKQARILESDARKVTQETAAGANIANDSGEDVTIEEESDGQMTFDNMDDTEKKEAEEDAAIDRYRKVIIEELSNIQKFLPADPLRTKIEIGRLINKIK